MDFFFRRYEDMPLKEVSPGFQKLFFSVNKESTASAPRASCVMNFTIDSSCWYHAPPGLNTINLPC